jgi:hypothetical protein
MRKQSVSIWISIVLCFLILTQSTTVSAISHTKVWIGTGLITAGIVLSAQAANDFCLGPGCDGGEGEVIAGVVMVGVGTVLLVMGLLDDGNANASKKQLRTYSQPVVVGFGPVKNGWAGAVRIRW